MESQGPEPALERQTLPVLERFLSGLRASVVRPAAAALPRWITPNILSGARLVLAGFVAALLLSRKPAAALVLFALAEITDALDGELARLRKRETRVGARLDPVVDKLLHGVVFLHFFPVEPVLIGVVLAGDVVLFIVGSVLAVHPDTRRFHVAASVFGKWKLVCQAVSALVLFWNSLAPFVPVPSGILEFILVLAIAFAGLSLFGYVRHFFLLAR